MAVSSPLSNLETALPAIRVGAGGTPVPTENVLRVVVDSHLHVPDMFEITLADRDFDMLTKTGLSLAATVEVWAGARGETRAQRLIVGEVTAIEGVFVGNLTRRTVVRGYAQDHRLQRVRRTRTFVNVKDSDIARQIANEAGLDIGAIDTTTTTYDHVGQANQSDWEFLSWRARNVGYEFGVAEGKFYFRRASTVDGGGAPPVALEFHRNLREFLPRLSAGNLSEEAEVRGWNNLTAESVTASAPVRSTSVKLDLGAPGKADQAAALFGPQGKPAPPPPGNSTLGDLGPAPSEKAHVVHHPLAVAAAADEALRGVAGEVASTFAEASGEALGDPALRAGVTANVTGVPDQFAGRWVITTARHVFDRSNRGYSTHFEMSGTQRRSLLGLASGGVPGTVAPVLPGLVCGIVSNVLDDAKAGRVKVTLPWLSPRYESDWAPVVQVGAGPRSGSLFLPEVGDQVLVGFEFGDPQRPYVLGGVLNNNTAYQKRGLGGAATKSTNAAGEVVWRGIVSPSGNRLAFHDELPPGQGSPPPTASAVVLGTGSGNLSLIIDQVNGTVALRCDPTPPGSRSPQGKLSIECGNAGVIDIKTGTGGTVNIDGGAQLNLKAMASIKIESSGVLELKGNPIKLN